MSLDKFINLLVPITLIVMMMAIGLSVPFSETLSASRKRGLLLRAAVANYLCVPAATIALLMLFNANPMVSAGFLILAVCPGAPYGPPATAIAKGDVTIAVGLMIILSASSAVIAPLLLHALLPLLAGNSSAEISLGRMGATLVGTQLLPLCVGLSVRNWYPAVAARIKAPANLLSMLLNVAAITLILVAQYRTLLAIRLRGVVAMLTLLTASLAFGWLLAWIGGDDRKAMTLTTSLRNVGVGLVIANGAFARTPALDAVLAYGLIGVLGSLLVALGWSRLATAPHPTLAGIP
jgi:bile acid:Na+ symporter, BASS family